METYLGTLTSKAYLYSFHISSRALSFFIRRFSLNIKLKITWSDKQHLEGIVETPFEQSQKRLNKDLNTSAHRSDSQPKMSASQLERGELQSSATPPGTSKSEVYIPDESPPYETPLDLRFPLHWDTKAEFKKRDCLQPALKLVQAELRPLGVFFHYGVARGMSHYSGCSPRYFRVDFDEAHESTWQEIHQTVVQSIRKHFGVEEYQNPVIRYVRSEKFDDWY